MQSSPNTPGFALPTNLDPPDTVCLTIEIPNDPGYIKAVIGVLYNTAIWVSWQRDSAKSGVKAAARMKTAWLKAVETIGKCLPPAFGSAGVDDGSDFMIRQNPTNPCILESSVSGVDWCQWADLSLCMNFGQQPGTGTTPPAPGGGTQETCAKLNANGILLLPTAVNSGDTILIESISGAGNDPGDPGEALVWRLPNGNQFFAGLDVGHAETIGTDPLPATNHMQIIAGIGNTPVYVPLVVGVPATVPSGVSNAQIWLQVNDSDLTSNNGSYDVCVTVTNNQTGGWVSTLDFTVNPFASFVTADTGAWSAGSGYSGGVNGSVPNWAQLEMAISSAAIDVMTVYYDIASLGGSNQTVFFQTNGSAFGAAGSPVASSLANYVASGAAGSVTSIVVVVSSGTSGGVDHIQKIVIQGHGPKPSQLP